MEALAVTEWRTGRTDRQTCAQCGENLTGKRYIRVIAEAGAAPVKATVQVDLCEDCVAAPKESERE